MHPTNNSIISARETSIRRASTVAARSKQPQVKRIGGGEYTFGRDEWENPLRSFEAAAEIHAKKGDYAKVLEICEELRTPTVGVLFSLLRAYLNAGRTGDIPDVIERVQKLSMEQEGISLVPFYIMVMDFYLLQEQFLEVRKVVCKLIEEGFGLEDMAKEIIPRVIKKFLECGVIHDAFLLLRSFEAVNKCSETMYRAFLEHSWEYCDETYFYDFYKKLFERIRDVTQAEYPAEYYEWLTLAATANRNPKDAYQFHMALLDRNGYFDPETTMFAVQCLIQHSTNHPEYLRNLLFRSHLRGVRLSDEEWNRSMHFFYTHGDYESVVSAYKVMKESLIWVQVPMNYIVFQSVVAISDKHPEHRDLLPDLLLVDRMEIHQREACLQQIVDLELNRDSPLEFRAQLDQIYQMMLQSDEFSIRLRTIMIDYQLAQGQLERATELLQRTIESLTLESVSVNLLNQGRFNELQYVEPGTMKPLDLDQPPPDLYESTLLQLTPEQVKSLDPEGLAVFTQMILKGDRLPTWEELFQKSREDSLMDPPEEQEPGRMGFIDRTQQQMIRNYIEEYPDWSLTEGDRAFQPHPDDGYVNLPEDHEFQTGAMLNYAKYLPHLDRVLATDEELLLGVLNAPVPEFLKEIEVQETDVHSDGDVRTLDELDFNRHQSTQERHYNIQTLLREQSRETLEAQNASSAYSESDGFESASYVEEVSDAHDDLADAEATPDAEIDPTLMNPDFLAETEHDAELVVDTEIDPELVVDTEIDPELVVDTEHDTEHDPEVELASSEYVTESDQIAQSELEHVSEESSAGEALSDGHALDHYDPHEEGAAPVGFVEQLEKFYQGEGKDVANLPTDHDAPYIPRDPMKEVLEKGPQLFPKRFAPLSEGGQAQGVLGKELSRVFKALHRRKVVFTSEEQIRAEIGAQHFDALSRKLPQGLKASHSEPLYPSDVLDAFGVDYLSRTANADRLLDDLGYRLPIANPSENYPQALFPERPYNTLNEAGRPSPKPIIEDGKPVLDEDGNLLTAEIANSDTTESESDALRAGELHSDSDAAELVPEDSSLFEQSPSTSGQNAAPSSQGGRVTSSHLYHYGVSSGPHSNLAPPSLQREVGSDVGERLDSSDSEQEHLRGKFQSPLKVHERGIRSMTNLFRAMRKRTPEGYDRSVEAYNTFTQIVNNQDQYAKQEYLETSFMWNSVVVYALAHQGPAHASQIVQSVLQKTPMANPPSMSVLNTIARAYHTEGHFDQALDMFRALKVRPNGNTLELVLRPLLSRQLVQDAFDKFYEYAAEFRSVPTLDTATELVRALLRERRTTEAATVLENCATSGLTLHLPHWVDAFNQFVDARDYESAGAMAIDTGTYWQDSGLLQRFLRLLLDLPDRATGNRYLKGLLEELGSDSSAGGNASLSLLHPDLMEPFVDELKERTELHYLLDRWIDLSEEHVVAEQFSPKSSTGLTFEGHVLEREPRTGELYYEDSDGDRVFVTPSKERYVYRAGHRVLLDAEGAIIDHGPLNARSCRDSPLFRSESAGEESAAAEESAAGEESAAAAAETVHEESAAESGPATGQLVEQVNFEELEVDSDGTRYYVDSDGDRVYADPASGHWYIQDSDGVRMYVDTDGTQYVVDSDGTKIFQGEDGIPYTVDSDGTVVHIDPENGHRYLEDSEGAKYFFDSDGQCYTLGEGGAREYLRDEEGDASGAESGGVATGELLRNSLNDLSDDSSSKNTR